MLTDDYVLQTHPCKTTVKLPANFLLLNHTGNWVLETPRGAKQKKGTCLS